MFYVLFMWFQCRLYKRFGCTDVECSGAYFEIAKCSFLLPIFQQNKFSYTRKDRRKYAHVFSLLFSSHLISSKSIYCTPCSCLLFIFVWIFFLLLIFFSGEKWNRLLLVYLLHEKRHIYLFYSCVLNVRFFMVFFTLRFGMWMNFLLANSLVRCLLVRFNHLEKCST